MEEINGIIASLPLGSALSKNNELVAMFGTDSWTGALLNSENITTLLSILYLYGDESKV